MDIFERLFVILIAGLLTENFILAKFLGICPFLGVTNKFSSSLGMGLAVIVTMVATTTLTFPIYMFVLIPLNITYMSTIVFILIIASFVQLIEMLIHKKFQSLYDSLGTYLPLLATNCAILGVTLLNVNNNYNFGLAVFNAFASGLGFLLVMLLFSTIRERVEQNDIPPVLRGTPITLITAAIMSLSLIGFGGIGR
jgi:electron transport complex protein RnfA